MKKVISFCLYGWQPHYREGAIRNADLCKIHYPDWEMWVYASPSISKDVLTALKDKNVKVMIVEDEDGPFFMNYRFLPPSDETVDYAIFRDTDSRVDEREAAAVNEWISQGTGLHIMRDHPWHGPHPTFHMMLGGMWGVKCDKIRDMKDIIFNNKKPCNHGYDQYLITTQIYPRFENDKTVHDEIFDKKPWPTPRLTKKIRGYNWKEMYLFSGCQYGPDDQPLHPEHVGMLEEWLKENNKYHLNP